MTYNLSLLMRSLFGIGTPKQAMAVASACLEAASRWLFERIGLFLRLIANLGRVIRLHFRPIGSDIPLPAN
jgi:hypothetical protein